MSTTKSPSDNTKIPGSEGDNDSSITTKDDGSTTSTGKEKSPADIPKEDLVHLCMKLNKRMQAMETKGINTHTTTTKITTFDTTTSTSSMTCLLYTSDAADE